MVEYNEIKLENGMNYEVIKKPGYGGCSKCFNKAVKSMNSLLSEGRPVSIISPKENLTDRAKEEYRAYFCREAKEVGRNLIYFEGPVEVKVSNPLEGTMFD